MAKISGNTSSDARIIIVNESNWQIESNTTKTGGAFEVNGLAPGKKTVISRATSGECEGFGNVSAVLNTDFVSSWDTTKAGASPAKTIALPLFNGGTYNFTVDYGDNSGEKTVTTYNDADATHTYDDDGTYTVTIKGQIDGFRFNNGGDKLKLVGISNWGTLKVGTNQGSYFYGCTNLVVTATDILDTSLVTDMRWMFHGCSLFNGSVAGWDTSNVRRMDYMFDECLVFNQPVDSWDTSKVMDMQSMFRECTVFNQPLTSWDTSSVMTMYAMFYTNGSSLFNQSIANFDVSSITVNPPEGQTGLAMNFMFYGANDWSQANYDATLIAWSALPLTEPNVIFHAGDAQYSTGAATTARGVLTGTYGWTIYDGGQN